MEEPEEAEPNASIMNRIRISRDKATILLILYQWNEQKFNSDFLLSGDVHAICAIPWQCAGIWGVDIIYVDHAFEDALNLKFLMANYFYFVLTRIVENLMSHDLSEEAQIIYNLSLKNSQHPIVHEQDTVWKKLVSLLKSSATSLVELG